MGNALALAGPLVKDSQIRERSEQFIINTPIAVPVQKAGYIEEILAGLDGDIVVAGGAASGVATGRQNPEAIVERIRVLALPMGEILNLDARGLLFWRVFDHGRSRLGTALTGAAGTFAQALLYPIPFAWASMAKPFDLALHTRRFDTLQVIFECGDQTDLLTGNDRTWTFTGLRFNMDVRRNLSAVPATPAVDSHLPRQFERVAQVTGASTAFSIKLPGGFRYKEILFTAEVDNALADTVINGIEIHAGGAVWFNKRSAGIKRDMARRISDAAQADTGLYLVDLAPSGMVTRTPDARGLTDVEAVLDVSAPAGTIFVRAYCRCIIPNENLVPVA